MTEVASVLHGIPAPEDVEDRDEAPALAGAMAAASDMVKAVQADLTGRGTILLNEDEDGCRPVELAHIQNRLFFVAGR